MCKPNSRYSIVGNVKSVILLVYTILRFRSLGQLRCTLLANLPMDMMLLVSHAGTWTRT